MNKSNIDFTRASKNDYIFKNIQKEAVKHSDDKFKSDILNTKYRMSSTPLPIRNVVNESEVLNQFKNSNKIFNPKAELNSIKEANFYTQL